MGYEWSGMCDSCGEKGDKCVCSSLVMKADIKRMRKGFEEIDGLIDRSPVRNIQETLTDIRSVINECLKKDSKG
jgi:hypothetical protein